MTNQRTTVSIVKDQPTSTDIKKYRSKVFENLISIDDLLTLELRGEFSRVTVYKWIRRGMPVRKIGGRNYFSPSEVALWLNRKS